MLALFDDGWVVLTNLAINLTATLTAKLVTSAANPLESGNVGSENIVWYVGNFLVTGNTRCCSITLLYSRWSFLRNIYIQLQIWTHPEL